MGHQPRILIWDVKERVLLHECRGHKFGVFSLAFSPNMRYLVSIGFQHDGYIYVWNWRKGTKLAGNKITSKVNSLSFAKDGTYFVTAGLRHFKYWYLDARGRIPKRGNLSSRETQVLDGRSGILGSLRESNFVDVACDRLTVGSVYFLTDNGIMGMFKESRVIDKWVDLQVKGAYSLSVSSTYVICACANGIIRLFEPGTLKYCGMIPKPHPLGIDISCITSPESLPVADPNTCYPDIIAVAYDDTKKLTAVYSDRSLYVWDIRDLQKATKYRSFMAHSDCVWGVEACPSLDQALSNSHIPPNSFVTHSADGTIRFWNLDHNNMNPSSSASSISPLPTSSHPSRTGPLSPSDSTISSRRNIYSRELVKMLYVDTNAAEFSKLKKDVDLADDQLPDFGIRALKISNDGKLMATGDRSGNLRVHDMQTWEQITFQEAHDSEILSIDFSNPLKDDTPCLLATGSRDRLLHIFDVRRNFQLVQSLDDHSSSITAVKFTKDADKLISCGADKGVIFRKRVTDIPVPSGCFYTTYHNYSGRSTVFDMAMDVTARYVATVTGERRLYVFSIESGKPFCICKPETAEELANSSFAENSGGSLLNIDIDPFSGTYAVTSGSDRCLRLFDLTNSICIDKICAHAELVTSVKFFRTSTDSLRMISTCSDGTVFVWKVSDEIVARMKARASERDTKLRQAAVMGEYTARTLGRGQEDALSDEKRALLLSGEKSRLRRVSTAPMLRPTASISQMVRQGERKTFSSISPAEQKYENLYKKVAERRNKLEVPNTGIPSRFESPLSNSFTANQSTVTNTLITPPSSTRHHSRPSSTENSGKDGSKTSTTPPRTPSNTSVERKTPEIQGKLGRLYNGLPTSGRERLVSQASHYQPPQTPKVTPASGRERLVSQVSHHPPPPTPKVIPTFGQPRQPQSRMNQVLRRQISRDGLNRKDNQSALASNTSPAKDSPRLRPRASETMLNKRANGGLYYGKKETESVPEVPGNSLRTPTPPKQRRSSGGDIPRQRYVEPPLPKREIPTLNGRTIKSGQT
ncbi:WD40-repeat-containing domain protein [Phycomyces nitens]|nr:WD40-repeat-containing domain protein [Phycomyces nitens]